MKQRQGGRDPTNFPIAKSVQCHHVNGTMNILVLISLLVTTITLFVFGQDPLPGVAVPVIPIPISTSYPPWLIAFLSVPAIITAIAGVYVIIQNKSNARMLTDAKEKRKEASDTAVETSEELKKVHLAVNSERTAMMTKLDEMNATVLRISEANKTLEEKIRGQDLAAAVATKTDPIV